MMSRLLNTIMIFVLALLVLNIFVTLPYRSSFSSSQPSYARPGSYATYTVLGGFIPFFDGVSGNVSYLVTNVFNNGSMIVRVDANVSEGSEVPTSYSSFNVTDNIFSPRALPIVPLANLSASTLEFENVTCSFVQNTQVTVPAGKFSTVEFRGSGQNGTVYFWFDQTTGLAVEMSGYAGAFELSSSNIALPAGTPSSFGSTLPYYLVFGGVWTFSAVLFLGVRRYYRIK